jgi:putative hydrolase of the HAD superfamily
MHYYRSLPIIKAMTFDLDDTLYDNGPVIADLEQAMVVWMGKHHPKTQHCSLQWWAELRQRVIKSDPELKHDVTEWRRQQVTLGFKLLGYDVTRAQYAADMAMVEVLRLRNLIDVPQETHRVLSILAERVPLIAITNGNVDPSRIGLSDYFQSVLQAGPDGKAKPFPDMFCAAQVKLNLPVASILHVGDDLATDVYGALKNGYSSCWFNSQSMTLRHAPKVRVLPHIEIAQLADLIALV